jgi:hypothetical protein
LLQLQQHEQELKARGVDVVAVTFETEKIARTYAAGLPWPVLLDPSRQLYTAYGMRRGSFVEVWGPASWWGFLKLLCRGRRFHLPTDDVYQMGGDVLIDESGVVRLHYVSRYPLDRPPADALLSVVRGPETTAG